MVKLGGVSKLESTFLIKIKRLFVAIIQNIKILGFSRETKP